ncbi:AAA family ATPase [Pseudonocardia sp.]|uniref:ATP-binding protein n=1 Tax=Pseudonocardia sp. TaxID=60912 RepID=UPI0026286EB3|nr:AAA family ATPase [Pseudonocardia sp.]
MSPDRLRLSLLGTFDVRGDLDAAPPAGQAQRLLKVLAAHEGRFVPVDVLIDVLWDRPPDHAERNIAVLVSRLRRALGRERLDGGPAGYRLVLDERTTVDLFEARDLVVTAEQELAAGRPGPAAAAAERATGLLVGGRPLTEERDAPWTAEVRLFAEHQLRRARRCWWAAAAELGAHRTVVEVTGAALRADPLDEEASRAAMTAHRSAGESGRALLVYRALRTALADQLGVDPSPATQSLFLSILRAENGAPRRPAPRSPDPEPAPLVGRDRELRELLARWADALDGRSEPVLVLGEAGIGKSALVEALAVRAAHGGALVLTGWCREAERSLYLQPLLEAVRGALARLEPQRIRALSGGRLGTLVGLLPEIAARTGPEPYERVSAELEHRRSLEALATLLGGLAEDRPVLLVIEDLQHAGASTVEALHYLATHRDRGRLLVVVTERTSEDPSVAAALRDVAALHEVGPLAEPAVAELVRDSGLAYDVAKLYAWTGGSPLFVTELLRHPGSGTGALAIPGSLHEAVAQRLEHAGEDVATLLAFGAVLGNSFALDDVAAVSGLDVEDCAVRAARALRAGLLAEQGETFRFPNDIVRTVAYDAVPEPIRVSRHRRAARLSDARPETAARHLAAAHDWAEAARAWQLAAHAAHLTFANDEAERLLTDALDTAGRSGERALVAVLRLRRGEIRTELGRHDEARDDHEQALALARDLDDEELEARVLEQLGWTALYARDVLGAVDLAERATQLAESAAAARGALPSATLLLGRVRHWDGDYAAAGAAYARVLDAEPNPGAATTAMALAYQGALLQHQDRFTEARAVLERAAVLCRDTGQFRPLLQTLFFIGLARGDVGDFAGALRSLGRARALIDGYGVSFYRAGIETTTSWLWQELGDVGRAREHAELAVELAHRGGGALELEQELHALLALADCDLLVGRHDDAGARVEAAAPMLEQSLPFRPRATMRLLEMRARFDRSWAEALFEEARTHDSPKYQSLALAHLGRHEAAARVAGRTGSDLLIGRLGAPADRRAARDRIARALPAELRGTYTRLP